MAIDTKLIQDLMRTLRTKSDNSVEEIIGLAEACKKDLEIAGVYITNEEDPLYRQALKLYCKANYGYDTGTERFQSAYSALKDAMALSGDYCKEGDVVGGSDSTIF